MNKLGIIEEFDKLGRIVIPKELRERYSLKKQIKIVVTKDGVLIRNPRVCSVKKNISQKPASL